jgi:hypothetical protein
VTRASLREYAAVQRERYQQAGRAEKQRLLDEVVAVTGIHRKAAIRLLRRAARARATPGPGGTPHTYGGEVAVEAGVRILPSRVFHRRGRPIRTFGKCWRLQASGRARSALPRRSKDPVVHGVNVEPRHRTFLRALRGVRQEG